MAFRLNLTRCKIIDLNDRLFNTTNCKSWDHPFLHVELDAEKAVNEQTRNADTWTSTKLSDARRMGTEVEEAIDVCKRYIEFQIGPWPAKRWHQPRIWSKFVNS